MHASLQYIGDAELNELMSEMRVYGIDSMFENRQNELNEISHMTQQLSDSFLLLEDIVENQTSNIDDAETKLNEANHMIEDGEGNLTNIIYFKLDLPYTSLVICSSIGALLFAPLGILTGLNVGANIVLGALIGSFSCRAKMFHDEYITIDD
jgi:hypothetical protein